MSILLFRRFTSKPDFRKNRGKISSLDFRCDILEKSNEEEVVTEDFPGFLGHKPQLCFVLKVIDLHAVVMVVYIVRCIEIIDGGHACGGFCGIRYPDISLSSLEVVASFFFDYDNFHLSYLLHLMV